MALLLAACGEDDPVAKEPPPGPDDVVLIVDGMEITAGEIAEFDEYVATFDKTVGRKFLITHVLQEHVLPLHLARRAHAKRRKELQDQAQALYDVTNNDGHPGLVAKSEVLEGYELEGQTRNDLPMALARFAFDPANLFAVSPPLEVPHGFYVISTSDILSSPSKAAELVTLYLVPFLSFRDAREFRTWYSEQQVLLRDRVEYVHPNYKDALPNWFEVN